MGLPLGGFWWFGRVLGTGWNFDEFWDLPRDHPRGRELGRPWLNATPRALLPVTNPRLLIPKQPLDRIPDYQTGNWRLDTGNRTGEQQIGRLQSFPSQPGGP